MALVSGYSLFRVRAYYGQTDYPRREYSLELSVLLGMFMISGIVVMVTAVLGDTPPRTVEIISLAAFMAMSALAVRELERRPSPIVTPMEGRIGDTEVFLVEDEEEARLLLRAFHAQGIPIMAVSRRPHDEWVEKFGFKPERFLWLSSVSHPHAVSPSSLYIIREEAVTFMRERGRCVVYMDGIEYMTFYSDFTAVAKLIFTLRDYALTTGAYLVVLASPETLEPMKFNVLAREFKRPNLEEVEAALSRKAFFGMRKEEFERLIGTAGEKAEGRDDAGGEGTGD
ncbi:hypothetical protein A3L11_00235 [Thermococcus siculi]|uniref:DUF835 domain-containing protein n=1 Tax=Thermococcus siculi TaxID=72803 RepID=A0A2Z2MSQ4_9EURY|nr:hypothetical protein A3L11_00235 [Thermococcus siculi]